jgi:multidrug resistance protein
LPLAPFREVNVLSKAHFADNAYDVGISEMVQHFDVSQEVVTLGLSFFVLGFAVGPLFWAPLSELYGRQVLFFGTFAAYTVFNVGCAVSQNIHTLIILRFFAASFGSSPLTNAGGVIADIFEAADRGVAMAVFAVAPFMGPALGPIVGGFLGESAGWRWIEGFLAAFSGVMWLIGSAIVPETYAPVLLRRRAENLSQITGKVYRSRTDIDNGEVALGRTLQKALSRPWILLIREPIVLMLSTYQAIIYGILFLMFAAFPIVYGEERGWSAGITGLAFVGVAIGMLAALIYAVTVDHYLYRKVLARTSNNPPPEARLHALAVGGVALPIGLFWFAWSNSPDIHWAVSVAAGIPFGFGMVLLFLALINYLVDAYTIYAASVLAASTVLRAVFAAVFPLFTTQMYHRLGIHWASSIPAFLALACMPFPFLVMRYGGSIRSRCKYAAKAAAFKKRMEMRRDETTAEDESTTEDENKMDDEIKSS